MGPSARRGARRRGWPRRSRRGPARSPQAPLVVRLQHKIEEAAPPIFGDVIRALAVGIELDPLAEAAGLDGEQVARGVVVLDPELVSGILATRLVVGVKVESEDGKYWTSRRDCT